MKRLRSPPCAWHPLVGSMAFALWVATSCGSEPTGPGEDGDQLTEIVVTADYRFQFAAGDGVEIAWQESYHAWLHAALALPPTPRVEYRKYRDAEHMGRVTGFYGNGWSEPDGLVLHTIWSRDNHEIVHVLVNHHLGVPPGLFSEGVAVAHQVDPDGGDEIPRWNGRSVHGIAREMVAAGRVPGVDALLETEGFAGLDPELTYPLAGSFVAHLLDEAGLAAFKSFVRTSQAEDPAAKIREDFERAYGGSIDEWWEGWLETLRP